MILSFGFFAAMSSKRSMPVSGRTAKTNWSQDGITVTALSGSGSLKMPFPFTATDNTQAGLMIARSASSLATAKMPSDELTANNVTGLRPAALRRITFGWNHSGTGCSFVLPHISDAISKTRRERVTLGLMAGVVLVGILV